MKRVLITCGAGFIGSHLADDLLARGFAVCPLDALIPRVHGSAGIEALHGWLVENRGTHA